jgi:hypothetical protein
MHLSGVFFPGQSKLVAVAEAAAGAGVFSAPGGSAALGGPAHNAAVRAAAAELVDGSSREQAAQVEVQAQPFLDAAPKGGATCRFAIELSFAPAPSAEPAKVPGAPHRTAVGALPSGIQGGSFSRADSPDVAISGSARSQGCGVELSVRVGAARMEWYHGKAVRYCCMIVAAALVQVAVTLHQMEAAGTAAAAARVSLLCVGAQTVADGYLCLLHLTLAILVEPMFNAFATTAFAQVGCCP